MGPVELLAVRHGESVLNAVAADADRAVAVDPTMRDADVPLSPRGREQAARLGRWLAGRPADRTPDRVLCSPYTRAADTAALVVAELARAGRPAPPPRVDERLRDREWLNADSPLELDRHRRLGLLYYRPPGGEAMTDVALRLRTLLADLRRDEDGQRVLVVAHDAVVLMLRYVIEGLAEDEVVRLAASDPVRNAAVTRWVRDGEGLRLTDYNRADHLRF